MRAAGNGLGLVLAMVVGVPAGSACWVAWQLIRHPWLGRAVLAHPLVASGLIAGGSGIATVAWGAAALAGIDLARQANVLHGWIVAAACAIYLCRNNPFRADP